MNEAEAMRGRARQGNQVLTDRLRPYKTESLRTLLSKQAVRSSFEGTGLLFLSPSCSQLLGDRKAAGPRTALEVEGGGVGSVVASSVWS